MRRTAMVLVSGLFSFSAHSADIANIDIQCAKNSYHDYVDASIEWYENLVRLTIKDDPKLKDVAEWFMDGRKKHFLLNKDAFDWYINNDESKLDFNTSVESWLKLSQEDIRKLSLTSTPISGAAKEVFDFRQGKAHADNYALRTAFADLLSHPKKIEEPLGTYNQKIEIIGKKSCLK